MDFIFLFIISEIWLEIKTFSYKETKEIHEDENEEDENEKFSYGKKPLEGKFREIIFDLYFFVHFNAECWKLY